MMKIGFLNRTVDNEEEIIGFIGIISRFFFITYHQLLMIIVIIITKSEKKMRKTKVQLRCTKELLKIFHIPHRNHYYMKS